MKRLMTICLAVLLMAMVAFSDAAVKTQPGFTNSGWRTAGSGINAGGTLRVLPEWTFMVYLDGDNNLESYAIDDFLEMASVGSTADVQIVVLFDRHPSYASTYGNWTDARRGIINLGDVPDTSWGQSVGEVNMGDPCTLCDFVEWGMQSYPSEKYAVILWNHGDGWRKVLDGKSPLLKAVCSDDTSADELRMKEVRTALECIEAAAGEPDLVGFDACLMGMTEVAYEICENAQVMVASEETEPVDGWPYNTILADLVVTPSMGPADLGSVIVERYYESYGNNQTLSVVDLLQVCGNLATQVDTLAQTLRDNWDSDPDACTAAAGNVMTALDSAVIAEEHGTVWPGSHGLAIYFPEYDYSFDPDYNGSVILFPADIRWEEFLQDFYSFMGGSWVAQARSLSQDFIYPEHVDMYDFCQKLTEIGSMEEIVCFTLNSDPGWTKGGLWGFGEPLGGGSFCGDPTSGHTGTNVYGYNLSGDYTNSMPQYYLTTTAMDCSEYKNVTLHFWRWLGVESASFDHAKVEVSNDGSIWSMVWNHTGASFCDGAWIECSYDISSVADEQSTVYIRWTMGPTDGSVIYPGWNIDDICLLGVLKDHLHITPSEEFNSSGDQGGPFDPCCMTYTLTNIGDAPLDWEASAECNWVTIVPNGGTLLPGEPNSVDVDVCINEQADTLPRGLHTCEVTFTNTDTDYDQSRNVELCVEPQKILAYTQYADPVEYENVLTALDDYVGKCYTLDEFDDYIDLESKLPGHDVLLIPEPQGATQEMLEIIGAFWKDDLELFIENGGIIVHCDGSGKYGILTGAELMDITGSGNSSGYNVTVVAPDDPVAKGVSQPYTAMSNSRYYITDEERVVVERIGYGPVVIHKLFGLGDVILIGHDYNQTNDNQDLIVGNAVFNIDDLAVEPVEGFSSVGYELGPFTPWRKGYAVGNRGTEEIAWEAYTTCSWLTVDPNGGTLLPGRPPEPVWVSLTPDVNDLWPGTYSCEVVFKNLESGNEQKREVNLEVTNVLGNIDVTDSIDPNNDHNMPFRDVILGLTRQERVTITNVDPNLRHEVTIEDIYIDNCGSWCEDFEEPVDPCCWQPDTPGYWSVVSYDSSLQYRVDAYYSSLYGYTQSLYTCKKWRNAEIEVTVDCSYYSSSYGLYYNYAGVILRATDDFNISSGTGSAYVVFIRGDRYFKVTKYIDGVPTDIVYWTYSSYLNYGYSDNIVKTIIDGSTIEVYFNPDYYPNPVWTGSDSDISDAGYIGLVAYRYTNTSYYYDTYFYFDNLCVYAGDAFSLELPPDGPPWTLWGGDDPLVVDVNFVPTDLTDYECDIVIESNDPCNPVIVISMSGTGILDYLVISEVIDPIFEGHPGGPFMPSHAYYDLSNIGPDTIRFCFGLPEWLQADPNCGYLEPEECIRVQITPNEQAENLPEGFYEEQIIITNITTTKEHERTAVLNLHTCAKMWLDPYTINMAVEYGATETTNLTIGNSGDATLDFTLTTDVSWIDLNPAGGIIEPGGEPIAISVTLDGALDPCEYIGHIFVSPADDCEEEQTVPVHLTVSPIYFTELFDDEDNDLAYHSVMFKPTQSASQYEACGEEAAAFPVDPSGGTVISLQDEDYEEVSLGDDSVILYETNHSFFYIGSNGYITFEIVSTKSGDVGSDESIEQHFSLPRISALFDDLDPSAGGTVSWKKLDDRAVVTYQNVPEYGLSNSNSFQIEMFFNGVIRITWLGISANDGLAGLSEGAGVPEHFGESDLSEYGPCSVDMDDLIILARYWLSSSCSGPDWCGGADFNTDGDVNNEDFARFKRLWQAVVE